MGVVFNPLTGQLDFTGGSSVTVTDSAEIDFTLTGQDITASIIAGSIDETKLDTSTNASLDLADSASQATGVEDNANVTDTANVTSAGALMDSEVTNLAQVKAFDSTDYAAALGADDNYVTDAEKVVVGNTSGTNTGDVANTAITTNPLSQFASTTSAQLAGVISNETGTGVLVFGTSPTFTTDITAPVIYGGTVNTNNLDLWANNVTPDTDSTGRIRFKDRLTFSESLTIDNVNAIFVQVSTYELFKITGTIAMNPSSNGGGVKIVSAANTMQYTLSQALASAPTFEAQTTVQPVAAVTDNGAEWYGFAALGTYSPLLSTAVTAQTTNTGGYSSSPQVKIATGSHASSAAIVDNMTAFDAFHISVAREAGAQSTVTTLRGFWAGQPRINGSGVITNSVGLGLSARSNATNNTQILLGTDTSPAGNWNIHSTTTNNSAMAGPITIGAVSAPVTSALIDMVSTTKAPILPRMTTAQRDALTAVNGMMIYNTTLNKVQVYEGGAWASVI